MKIKDNPPSLPHSLAFHKSKKAMVDEESKKTKVKNDCKTLRQSDIMITIRKATPEDASVIIDFQQKMAWETEHMTLVGEIIIKGVKAVFDDSSRGQYWVAENNGIVAASLLITYEWSDWRNCNVWWFQSVYVLPEFRRMGIFRAMYQHIKNEAADNASDHYPLLIEFNFK